MSLRILLMRFGIAAAGGALLAFAATTPATAGADQEDPRKNQRIVQENPRKNQRIVREDPRKNQQTSGARPPSAPV